MSNRVVKYKMWKQSRHKWDSFVYNRHRENKLCSDWDYYILDCIGKNSAIAYDCGGLFYKDLNQNITVVENSLCPINVNGMLLPEDINQRFDNMILINPITLKYNFSIVNFLTTSHNTRGGPKPNFINWLKKESKIFLSFSDWHLYFDRLKYSIEEIIDLQVEDLEKNSFTCVYKDIVDVNKDFINGNVKLVLQLK